MNHKADKHIPLAEPDLTGNEIAYVVDAIEHEKRISNGKYVERFENECKRNFGRKYANSCSNGTVALHLAMMALHIGPGDEVIIPSFTFAASASAVLHAGATPVFVDVSNDTWNLDIELLETKRTPRTRAVMAVDIYGVPAAYDALEAWCHAHNILLIEDAAEAHGAVYRNKPTGSFGNVSVFSFYGNKILTTGEGGVLLTDNEEVYERARILKNHGMKQAGLYDNDVLGYNYRLTNIQAAIGCAQFERFEQFLSKRRENEKLYKKLLSHPRIQFQSDNDECQSAPWLISMRIKDASIEDIRSTLLEKGIETRPLFKPLHLHRAYNAYASGTYPVSEQIWKEGISLPSSSLLTAADIQYVAEQLLPLLA